jgi:hypothetical protein
MPRFLTAGEFAGNKMSNNARMLYALLLDRHRVSVKNNWFDDSGEAYIYFRRDEMEAQLGLSDKTVAKAVQELKNHLLLEEKQQGMNRPNKIYLLSPVIGVDENPEPYLSPEPDYGPEKTEEYTCGAEPVTAPPPAAEYLRFGTRNSSAAGDGTTPAPDTEEFRPSNNKTNNNNKNNNELSDTAADIGKMATEIPAAAAAELPNNANLPVPYSQILSMYNELCETTGLRPIRSISGKRKDQTAARFKDYGFSGFVDLFGKVSASDFLCGGGSRGWKADFDWLTAPTNMPKVLEGKYDNGQNNILLPQIQYDPCQTADYSNTTSQKNTQGRHDPFLERAMAAYATAAQSITS